MFQLYSSKHEIINKNKSKWKIKMSEQDKLNIGLTFFLSLGFFLNLLAWTIFDAQVPITLFIYLQSYALVGFWMILDNILGIFIIPVMGSISDNTRTKYGRRMPYLMVGIPISAVFLILISTISAPSDPFLLLTFYIIMFNIAMASFRSQTIALMPDFTKPIHRSKGYAIFNLMAGVGTIVGFILSLTLVRIPNIGLFLAFLTVAIIMVLCLVIMVLKVKEENAYSYQQILQSESETKKEKFLKGLVDSFKYIGKSEDKSVIFLLLGIFCWFCGYYALRSLFSAYAFDVFGMERAQAGFMLFYMSLPFVLMVIPAGIIATKIGRRLPMKIGLILFALGMFLAFLVPTITMITVGLIISGIGFAFVNTLAVVLLWELVPTEKRTGTYTGIYFLGIFFGAIFGPLIVGTIMDLTGAASFFLQIAIFLILGLICMFFVKKGEAGDLTETTT